MIKLETTTAYTLKEAADIVNKNEQTLRLYIKNGKLKAQKVGGTWYVTDKTLTELVTGKEV